METRVTTTCVEGGRRECHPRQQVAGPRPGWYSLPSLSQRYPASVEGRIMSSRTGVLALSLTSFLLSACSPAPSFDLIVTGGRVIDGTGGPSFVTDIAINDGIIEQLGDLSDQRARRTIDAEGLVVTPGFIDMMGGSTLPLLLDPISAESKLRQGITTMMVGEGRSLAPQSENTQRDLERATERGFTWTTFEEYFRLLEEEGVALNVIHNVGAAQVRMIVIGDEDRDPTPEQLDEMKRLVAQAMEDGAIGLSTALIYPPGSYAKTDELIELAKVAAEHGGVYFTHMRNESNRVLEAIEESIRIGRAAGIPTHIYHLKAAGQENWPLMAEALQLIEAARSDGLEITADVYPYIRNGIGLGSFIHPRHYARGAEPFLQTLSDQGVRARLRREIETTSDWENWYRHVGRDWNNVLISRVRRDSDSSFVGLSVKQVADRRGVDVWEAFFDLVEGGGVSVNPKSMNEEQKHEAMRAAFMTFDNDASPTNPSAVASAHPRAFGAFPRILAKYVRDENVISMEEAVRKLTSLPATILKLERRGRISAGMIADLIIFDPQTIQDRATFTEPLVYSEGIGYVVVSGQLVIDQGRATDTRPGKVLTKPHTE